MPDPMTTTPPSPAAPADPAPSSTEPGAGGEGGEGAEPQGPLTTAETTQRLREAIAEGKDPVETAKELREQRGGAEETSVDITSGAEGAEGAESAESAEDTSGETLPEGWYRDDQGRLRNAQGDFARMPSADETAEGQVAGEESTAEGGDTEHPADLTVSLPGRRPDDESLVLPLDSSALEELGLDAQEVQERVNQLENGYARRAEANRMIREAQEEIAADREELDFVRSQLSDETTAADFLARQVPDELRHRVLETMLAELDDESFNSLLETTLEYERNPTKRREDRLDARENRMQRERQASEQVGRQREAMKTAQDIASNVLQVIPEDWSDARAETFFDLAMLKLEDHFQTNGIEGFDPAEATRLLGEFGLLDQFGLSPNGDGPASTETRRPVAPARSKERPGQTPPKVDREEEFQTRKERRRTAAAVAPAGSGSSVAGIQKPKGLTPRELTKHLRKSLGIS